jgi:hypothetical protein
MSSGDAGSRCGLGRARVVGSGDNHPGRIGIVPDVHMTVGNMFRMVAESAPSIR